MFCFIRFYYQGISNLDAERILTQEKHSLGTFLVWRESTRTSSTPKLSVLGRDRVYHCPISQEVISRYSTPESFVNYFQAESSTLACNPTVPCLRKDPLGSLRAPEPCPVERSEHLRESRFANLWRGYFGEERKKVLVKEMKSGCSSVYQFQSEAVVMKDFRHVNILKMEAFVSGEQLYIITEPVLYVSLLNYFEKTDSRAIEVPALVNISTQVAAGMAYLESHGCIHRNLAARNVMLTEAEVKIANFSQACYTPSGKLNTDPGLILLRWAAPEVIWENTFSCKSDVWSFGVFLWEVFTHGELPYPRLKDDAVRETIRAGRRLLMPQRCPQLIYSLMTDCWKNPPSNRPRFYTLVDKLNAVKHQYAKTPYYSIIF